MQKNKTQLTEDLTTFNVDQLDKYIKINGVQAITGLLFNSVLKNLVQRNQDDIDSNFNLLTNDTDDIVLGVQNRPVMVVEDLTARDNLTVSVGDIVVVQENLDSNIEAFIWDGAQWVSLYEVVSGAVVAEFEELTLSGLPTHANEAAAIVAGLSTNQVYKTSTGELRIKL